METTEVIIVGAGPAGLALAISLAKLEVKSVIFEKELEITQDPRGVYLTYEAVRILWDLGIGPDLADIGHEATEFNFHTSSFSRKPFHAFNTEKDGFLQTVPNGLFQIQPKLELALRKIVEASAYCNLRCSCKVIGRQLGEKSVIVEYSPPTGEPRFIHGSWLIGADGKTGIVRKQFLESSAGIKQVDSSYKYDGNWVAANLKLTMPTPRTHPKFPLWKLGHTPESVYDLFWPEGWHFCSPPVKPSASGRFGPHKDRLWRHEFALDGWSESMDAEQLLWENLTPMITLKGDKSHTSFPCGDVTYPRDCIEILRCRPFGFTHKLVNKWFDDRTLLIGDAAHVFPPFGGEGIASGIRDAHQLAWRLFLLQRLPKVDRSLCDEVLGGWARERTHGVKNAASLTRLNEQICNNGDTVLSWISRQIARIAQMIPFLPDAMVNPYVRIENRGYKPVERGFFSTEYGGGGRVPQIYIRSQQMSPMLSDRLLSKSTTAMTLLIVARSSNPTRLVSEAQAALRGVGLTRSILSEESAKVFSPNPSSLGDVDLEVYFPVPPEQLEGVDVPIRPGYSGSNFLRRFNADINFVIIRADFYIFALAKDAEELVRCLELLKRRLRL